MLSWVPLLQPSVSLYLILKKNPNKTKHKKTHHQQQKTKQLHYGITVANFHLEKK